MKHPEPHNDLNPSFKVNIKPLSAMKGKSGTQLLNVILPHMEKMLRDYKLTQPPMEIEISGLKGAYAHIDYSLVTADDSVFPTTSEIWVVPRGECFFLLGAGTRQDERSGTRKEIKSILDTVRITH